jgi:hypothetical protein
MTDSPRAVNALAAQKLVCGTNHNRPQGARARLDVLFVTTEVGAEMVFK